MLSKNVVVVLHISSMTKRENFLREIPICCVRLFRIWGLRQLSRDIHDGW